MVSGRDGGTRYWIVIPTLKFIEETYGIRVLPDPWARIDAIVI